MIRDDLPPLFLVGGRSTAVRTDDWVSEHLPAADLDRCFDFAYHQRNLDRIFERTLAEEA